jgi:hypothetical protein
MMTVLPSPHYEKPTMPPDTQTPPLKAPQTIRIDPEVWQALQRLAVPFVDTPNDVLRRLLGLDNKGDDEADRPSPPARGAGKTALYFVNTDAKSYGGRSYHDEWLARGVAVTSGHTRFREKLAAIGCGDAVLMYANGVGVVAVGVTLDDRVQVVAGKSRIGPGDSNEYHRRVRWHRLEEPIGVAKIKELCGQTPLQTVQQVRNGEDGLRRLLEEPLDAISGQGDD